MQFLFATIIVVVGIYFRITSGTIISFYRKSFVLFLCPNVSREIQNPLKLSHQENQQMMMVSGVLSIVQKINNKCKQSNIFFQK